jgi:drug/metabolite transporter (DMT)-like permease
MAEQTSATSRREERGAVLALLLGTVCWGCGFTWAKAAGEAVQHAAGLPPGHPFGPIFVLAWRFLFAAIVWLIIFPAARRGWTWRGAALGARAGVLCGLGLILQHVGLDRTSEAVSAFLTSLTILFVPLIMLFAGRPPRPVLWVGVALASGGVWLMTGATPTGFGWGEVLGLMCAFTFSLYILAVNAAVKVESPYRVTVAQFAVVAAVCMITCAFLPGGTGALAETSRILAWREVWLNTLLLTVFPTLIAFSLLTFFQPKVDPTRAALIYLAEPVFATIYAGAVVRHHIGATALGGAGLILVANALVEILSARSKGGTEEQIVLVD